MTQSRKAKPPANHAASEQLLRQDLQFPSHGRPARRRLNPVHTQRSRTLGSDHPPEPGQTQRQWRRPTAAGRHRRTGNPLRKPPHPSTTGVGARRRRRTAQLARIQQCRSRTRRNGYLQHPRHRARLHLHTRRRPLRTLHRPRRARRSSSTTTAPRSSSTSTCCGPPPTTTS